MPLHAYDEYTPVSSRTSVALRAMMAFTEIDPDEEYMEDMMTSSDVRLAALEPCWWTLKATTGREIIEHFNGTDARSADRDYYGHPFWCAPCEGYNVLGRWFDCDIQHQIQHKFVWNMEDPADVLEDFG